jgi:hypothetical protein
MTRSVPNLRNSYGRRYKVERDPAATDWADPWMHTIPTRTGTVYVHSATHAGVEVKSRLWGPVRKLEAAGYPLHVGGPDVTTFLVPLDDLEAVLPLLRPYRLRQLSPAEKKRRTDQILANQFPLTEARKIRAQNARKGTEATRRPFEHQRAS